jgi:hypothetical protein
MWLYGKTDIDRYINKSAFDLFKGHLTVWLDAFDFVETFEIYIFAMCILGFIR